MKVLFAVSNEKISESIIKKYQSMYKEIITGKNVYYFNAILKELQKDKSYERIVISEDLEPFTNKNYEAMDNFIFEKLDGISDEAVTNSGEDIPIILIGADRRTNGDPILNKLFGIGVYSTLIGQDRSIDKLCELIHKPRAKKEAKIYYNIDSNDVDYKSEIEDNVSEVEIQNILTHYKRLGKNEEKYVESFESIANQYTDEQLKIIIKFLPLGVKAVLEEKCPKYQQIAAFAGEPTKLKNQPPYKSTQYNPKTNKPRSTEQAIVDDGIKIESIGGEGINRLTKPVVIPNTVSTKNVKKVRTIEQVKEEHQHIVKPEKKEKIEVEERQKIKNMNDGEENIQPVKRGRGRPKKVQEDKKQENETQENLINGIEEPTKKRRGRPKKVQEPIKEQITEMLPGFDENILPANEEEEGILPGFENINSEKEQDNVLPGFKNVETTNNTLPGFEDNLMSFDEPSVLPGFETESKTDVTNPTSVENTNTINSGNTNGYASYNDNENYQSYQNNDNNEQYNDYQNNNYKNNSGLEENYNETRISDYANTQSSNINNLLTADKKIVAFVGTSKNGTSFLVNNMAEMFSNQGIKTAILDLTKNKNAYYIYTKNEEALRTKAMQSTENLVNGVADGIPVNKNLDVYTSLPGEENDINEYEPILSTLAQNYSLVLLDCDFETNYGYIKEATEIYLVQSMDVLTIQPLTGYLRELKAKNVLEQSKLRIVINKYTRVRSVTEKTIIAGMAFYNDPSMSFMTELFNREKIRYAVVPFDIQTYSKYLEGLINCSITTHGYSKEMMNYLRKLASMVYPLINNTQNKYNNPKYNKYAERNNSTFSNDMNNTLDKMKRGF